MFVRGDDVHVAFDDDRLALRADGLAGAVERVEHAALVEDRRLRGVDVLGVGAVHRAAREPGDASVHVAQREHEPSAEHIPRGCAVVAAQDEPGAEQQVVVEAERAEAAQEFAAGGGCVADAEAGGGVLADVASFRVGARLRSAFGDERLLEELLRRVVERVERIVIVPLPPLLNAHARLRGEEAHRSGEVGVLRPHDEREHVAAGRTSAETAPGLPVREDDERGRALLVEGAARLVAAAGALQVRDVAGDDIDDVEARPDVVHSAHTPLPDSTSPEPLRLHVFGRLCAPEPVA